MRVRLRRLWAAACVAMLLPVGASAQQTATITGRVVDQSSQQPLSDVQVQVVGTMRGARTDESGQYRIVGVNPGTMQVRALRLGYQQSTTTVTVGAGETATADFSLQSAPLTLDQVIITATGEEQRLREVGNAVSSIDSVNLAVVNNFSQMIAARAPGVIVGQSAGQTGSGAKIRIRGANSVSLSNEPLIIVDGVRVTGGTTGIESNSIGVGGQEPSRFNDLNPAEIERIEILKGPAASALYGTAAANGVIQITTKRGVAGQTRWNAHVEAGSIHEITAYPDNYAALDLTSDDGPFHCPLYFAQFGDCQVDSVATFNALEQVSPFRTGWRQVYGLNVSGGGDAATYFLSGDLQREQGVYEPNKLRQINLRANIRGQMRENLDATVTAGFVSSRLRLPQNDNNGYGAILSGMLGRAYGTDENGFATPVNPATDAYDTGLVPDSFYVINTQQQVSRFTGGINSNWQPLNWLSFVGTAGLDLISRFDTEILPPNRLLIDSDLEAGYRDANRFQIATYTANLGGTARHMLAPTLESTTSLGMQFSQETLNGVLAGGSVLLPGTGSLEGTSARPTIGERNRDNVTIGGYVSQQLAWNDRLFLTGSVRGDDNSAFGSDFGFVYYPAAAISWVIGEEDFFPENRFVSGLRLRAAYGASGQRPSFRDALTFYTPVAVRIDGEDVPAVTLGGTGNAELEPERSHEFEFGFEAGFFDGRAVLDLTFYDKTTTNALIARTLAPSLGATATRFENLGRVTNKGLEGLLTLTVLDRPEALWNITLNGSTNRNRLIDLGEDDTPIIFGLSGNTQRHQEGYPLGGYWQQPYTWADENGDNLITIDEIEVGDTAVFLGSTQPTKQLSLGTEVTLWGFARLSGLLDYRGGFKQWNSDEEFRCDYAFNCRGINDPSSSLWEQARAQVAAHYLIFTGYMEDADFVKLREVALTLMAPERWNERFGVNGLSLTIAGRNLGTWTDYTGTDPEVNFAGQSNFTFAQFGTQPQVRSFITRLSFGF